MTDSVPVSPAAQAVDGGPPDLWWSPGLAADTFDAQDGVVTEDRGQLYRQQNATWRYIEALPVDAVRLVPAPGPDTGRETELLRSLDHLAEMWSSGRTYSPSARPEDDLRSTLARHRGQASTVAGVTHRFPEDWSFDGDFDNHPGQPRFTCCGRLRGEASAHDRMAFSDDLVTCPGVRTDGETSQ